MPNIVATEDLPYSHWRVRLNSQKALTGSLKCGGFFLGLPAVCAPRQLDLVPRGCQSHTWGPAHLSSRRRQWGWWLTEVMSCSLQCEGFPPEIQLTCTESKTTRTLTNPTQHHPHVAPRRQGQQSAWWISALTRFSSSGPIRKILLQLVFFFFFL